MLTPLKTQLNIKSSSAALPDPPCLTESPDSFSRSHKWQQRRTPN
uniref:Uncharacterized protein n=1 Tax=Anguilla anguilla TaxID=7936 RepID=A0A0E9PZ98_ANGAN